MTERKNREGQFYLQKRKYDLLTTRWILDSASVDMRMAAATMESPTRATEIAEALSRYLGILNCQTFKTYGQKSME